MSKEQLGQNDSSLNSPEFKNDEEVDMGATAITPFDPQLSLSQGEWIEPGLEFRGPKPPKGNWNKEDWIEIPHQHYIPVSMARFLDALKRSPKAEEAGQFFEDFLEITEAIYHVHYYKMLKELKEDYEYFAPDTGEDARKGVSEEELTFRQRRFLNNFLKAMIRGNFNPFSEEDNRHAMSQDYLFDLPIDINWDIHDNRPIKDYLQYIKTPEGKQFAEDLELDEPVEEYLSTPKEFDDNVWVFYRGIEKNQTTGLFLMQKIDLFISKFLGVIVWPVQWIIEKVRGDSQSQATSSFKEAVSILSFGLLDDSQEQEKEEEAEESTSIFEKRWLRRVNLKNQGLKVKDLFRPLKLQEPALQRMICLFRLKPPRPPQFISKVPLIGKKLANFFKEPESETDWTLHIKMFNDIPLADSEMIFPEKHIRMKSFDVTMLILSAIGGLFAIRRALHSNSKLFMIIVFAALIAYILKLILGYKRVRANYMARVTRDLYHKNLDNNIGVVQYLVDSLEEQDLKEAILAYFILWEEGRPMTEKEIDAKAEEWLQKNFSGIEVDFEVDDALDKVIEKEGPQPQHHLPIVRVLQGEDGQTYYEALPLEQALRLMDEKWDNFYTYNV